MRKRLLALFAVLVAFACVAAIIIIPSSQLPQRETIQPQNDRFILLESNWPGPPGFATNYTISFTGAVAQIGAGLLTNVVFVNNFLTNTVFITNLVPILGTIVEGGYTIQPAVQNPSSNIYWWDFGLTNSFGLHFIYASLQATNDTVFAGPTNTFQWSLLSYDVIATGTERIWIPSNNAVQFNTNDGVAGWYYSNGWWVLFLSNGNIFRDTVQSNIVFEHQWITKGQ